MINSDVINKAIRDWVTDSLIDLHRADFERLVCEAQILMAAGYGLGQLRFVPGKDVSKSQIVPEEMTRK